MRRECSRTFSEQFRFSPKFIWAIFRDMVEGQLIQGPFTELLFFLIQIDQGSDELGGEKRGHGGGRQQRQRSKLCVHRFAVQFAPTPVTQAGFDCGAFIACAAVRYGAEERFGRKLRLYSFAQCVDIGHRW